jgi:hypothetical protein
MKKKHPSETEMFRRHPSLKLVLDYCMKRIELFVMAALVAGVGSCNHHTISQNAQWIGNHLQEKQQQIDELKNSK